MRVNAINLYTAEMSTMKVFYSQLFQQTGDERHPSWCWTL